jgi:zinc protease
MSTWTGGPGGGAVDRTRPPPRGPLRPYHFPDVHRRTLANGLTLLVAPVRAFPVVTVDVVLEAGGTTEDEAKAGAAVLVTNLLESGAGGMDAARLAETIDALGITLDSGITWDSAQSGFTCLRSRLEPACGVLADLVRRPAFPEREVERLRDERLALIRQRRATPSSLADEVEGLYVFAPGTPYARPLGGLAATLAGLTREDLAAFHAARWRPGGAALAVAGDVDPDEMAALVERWFGDWEGAPAPAPVRPARPRLDRTTVVVADRPGSVQSEVHVAHVGVERKAPDYFAVQVMNAILGGIFSSRLNLNLRERLGYTYGASSSFIARRQPGLFTASAAVQTEVTAHAVSEVLRDMREMQEAPPTAAELDDARNYLAGTFPLQLQTTDGVAGRLVTSFTHGLDEDYWDRYRERILSVSADEVLEAARRRLWPDRAAVVVAGDAAAVRGPLEELGIGPVEVLDPATLG